MEIRPYLRSPHFYETDGMNIVHHANYIHWMEEARVRFYEVRWGLDMTELWKRALISPLSLYRVITAR